jgi:hypothetical protein
MPYATTRATLDKDEVFMHETRVRTLPPAVTEIRRGRREPDPVAKVRAHPRLDRLRQVEFQPRWKSCILCVPPR